jgi:hypothetical protein
MHLVRITYKRLEKFLQFLDFFELGCLIMPMKMYPVPNQGLTGPLNNSGRPSTIDGSLYREAFGYNTLRFASHQESYMVQDFGKLNFYAFKFPKGRVYAGSIPITQVDSNGF